MLQTRSRTMSSGPPRRVGTAIALLLGVLVMLIAACRGASSSAGTGATSGPGETMGLESPAASGY